MKKLFCLFATLLITSSSYGNIVHDEDIDGDLSGDNLAPANLVFAPGDNEIHGSTTFDPLDRDFITISVNTGFELTEIILQLYNSDPGQQSFFAVEAGSQVTSTTNPANLLGSALIGFDPGSQQGDNVLDDLGNAGLGGAGFSGSLGPGTYTFWYQETGSDTSYEFNYIIQAIPEPGSTLLVACFGTGMVFRRQRQTK